MPWYPPRDKSGRFGFSPNRNQALSASKVGEWDEAGRRIREMINFVPDSKRIIQDAAQDAAEELKENLYTGEYENRWPALSKERQEEKDSNDSLGEHILIGYGDYVEAIKVIPMGPNVWAFGINKAATNRDGDSLVMIGMSHEYGGGGNPPRPHWRFAYREFANDVQNRLAVEAAKTVRGIR